MGKHTGYFPAMTGVRAIAAFMVYFHHYNIFNPEVFGHTVHNIVQEFHLGVMVFFVLSGFLITYRYYSVGIGHFGKYMINRFARIYPMYFLLTTLTFLVGGGLFVSRWKQFLYGTNITFVRGLFEDIKFSGIAQGWSLTVEEMFYITAPIAFFLIKKNKISIILLPIALIGLGSLLVETVGRYDIMGFFSTYRFMFLYTFLGRAFEFFIGMALALVFMKYRDAKLPPIFTYLGIVISIALIYVMSTLGGPEYPFGLFHPIGILINNLLLPLFGVAFIFWGLLKERTIVSRILSTRLFDQLGKSSYIFYLIHMGVVYSFLTSINSNHVFVFFGLIVVSLLMYHLIEHPLNELIRNKTKHFFKPINKSA